MQAHRSWMYRLTRVLGCMALCLMVALGTGDVRSHSLDVPAAIATSFTYQGYLQNAGRALSATCDMDFTLYGEESGGATIAGPVSAAVPVADGFFTVNLDFGAAPFTGDLRWLEIAVQCPGDAVSTTLPRQALTAAPYSLYSLSTGALHGRPVADAAPVAGEVLAWDGSQWGPAQDRDTIYAAGNQLALDGTTFDVLDGSGSGLDADMLDGRHLSAVGRLDRYSIPGGAGGTVTMTIPHYNTFQIAIGEAFGSPNRAAWLTGVENDGVIAWVGIDSSGTVVTGSNVSLGTTTTVITLGPNITLRCPGNGAYELVLTSSYEDVRAWVLW